MKFTNYLDSVQFMPINRQYCVRMLPLLRLAILAIDGMLCS